MLSLLHLILLLCFSPQQEAWIVETMGKFNRILHPNDPESMNQVFDILDTSLNMNSSSVSSPSVSTSPATFAMPPKKRKRRNLKNHSLRDQFNSAPALSNNFSSNPYNFSPNIFPHSNNPFGTSEQTPILNNGHFSVQTPQVSQLPSLPSVPTTPATFAVPWVPKKRQQKSLKNNSIQAQNNGAPTMNNIFSNSPYNFPPSQSYSFPHSSNPFGISQQAPILNNASHPSLPNNQPQCQMTMQSKPGCGFGTLFYSNPPFSPLAPSPVAGLIQQQNAVMLQQPKQASQQKQQTTVFISNQENMPCGQPAGFSGGVPAHQPQQFPSYNNL